MKAEFKCAECNKTFLRFESLAKNRKQQFCSKACFDEHRRYKHEKACTVCGKLWSGSRAKELRRKTCSDECTKELLARTTFKKGNTPHNYKGWKVSTQGYMLIHVPEHERADKQGYVKRANLVMEESIGRYLKDGEVVHHIDENKLNDGISNLMLFESNSEHIAYHYENGLSKIQGAPGRDVV